MGGGPLGGGNRGEQTPHVSPQYLRTCGPKMGSWQNWAISVQLVVFVYAPIVNCTNAWSTHALQPPQVAGQAALTNAPTEAWEHTQPSQVVRMVSHVAKLPPIVTQPAST